MGPGSSSCGSLAGTCDVLVSVLRPRRFAPATPPARRMASCWPRLAKPPPAIGKARPTARGEDGRFAHERHYGHLPRRPGSIAARSGGGGWREVRSLPALARVAPPAWARRQVTPL